MSEHGFLSPNPALLELEKLKKRPGLAHELGAGAPCSKCKEKCSGFQLHFWRKVCMNCRCGKAEHNVIEVSDPGFYFIGRLFDRPLRTKAEELVFMYGDVFEDEFNQQKAGVELKLDWVPPGVTVDIAAKYLKSLPQEHISIQGSDGAQRRKKQLEKQFPIHDVEPTNCHALSTTEIQTMRTYIDSVRENIAGQGLVQEIGAYSPPKLPERLLPHQTPDEGAEFIQAWNGEQEETYTNLPPPLPTSAPPGRGSELGELSGRLDQLHFKDGGNPSVITGTFHARPYQPGGGFVSATNRLAGSTGSSIASASPSPPHASPNHLESGDTTSPTSASLFRNMGTTTTGTSSYNPASQGSYNPSDSSSGRNPSSPSYNPASSSFSSSNASFNPSSPSYNPSSTKYNPTGSNGNTSGSGYNPSSSKYKPSGSNGNLTRPGYNPGGKYNPSHSFGSQTENRGNNASFNGTPPGSALNEDRGVDRLPAGFDPTHAYSLPNKGNGGAVMSGNLTGGYPADASKQRRSNQVGGEVSGGSGRKDKETVWRCSGCGGGMEPGEVAIFAERAGRDKCWHPACFSCSSCGELLEDLLYFYSKGKLFCGRDFAEMMKIPRCGACDELIFAAEYTGAENLFWHLKHFCCYLCDTPLAGHKYIPVNSQPHCLTCWQNTHGKVCVACSTYISPEEQRVTLGADHWHATESCFNCGVCRKSLLGGKMTRRGGTLLCSSACAAKLSDRQQQQELSLADQHLPPSPMENHRNSTNDRRHDRHHRPQSPPEASHIRSSWTADSSTLPPPPPVPSMPQPGTAQPPSSPPPRHPGYLPPGNPAAASLEPWKPLVHANKPQSAVHHKQQPPPHGYQNHHHGHHPQQQGHHHQQQQQQQIHRGYEHERAHNARIEGKRSAGRHVQFATDSTQGRRQPSYEDDIPTPSHSRDSSYSTIV